MLQGTCEIGDGFGRRFEDVGRQLIETEPGRQRKLECQQMLLAHLRLEQSAKSHC